MQGVIRASPGGFAASLKSNSLVISVNKTILNYGAITQLSNTYRVNPDCPYFFVYSGFWLVNASTGALSEPDIYISVVFNFLSGGVQQSTLSATLYGGSVASKSVNFPLVNLNYDPLAPSLAYCNSVGCVGIGGNNPPTSWALGTRWTSVVDSIQVVTSILDASTQLVTPSNYAFMNAVIQMPWG